jgi:hypothetical protein
MLPGQQQWDITTDPATAPQVFDEGVVRREELWVTGKLWNSDHAPSRVEPAIRKSLRALGVSVWGEGGSWLAGAAQAAFA